LSDDAYRRFQAEVSANPEFGDVMPGTGGFRKVRWADARRGKGRRGGLRIIYYWFPSDHQILLATIYAKDEVIDLSAAEKRALKAAIDFELEFRRNKKLRRERGLRRIQ
jgi:mRNA-degrading endonuclease RelE of RelBE toxin-antitoxin system